MANPWIEDAQRRYAALDRRFTVPPAPSVLMRDPKKRTAAAPPDAKRIVTSQSGPGMYRDTERLKRAREAPTIPELARSTYGALGSALPGASAVGAGLRLADTLGVPGAGEQADILAPKFNPEHGAYDLLAHKLPQAAVKATNYLQRSTPGEVWSDVKHGTREGARRMARHPLGTIADFTPFVGDVKQTGEAIYDAAQLRHMGYTDEADQAESYVLPMAGLGLIPEAGGAAYKGTRSLINKALGRAAEDPLIYGSSPLYRPGADASGYQGPDWTGAPERQYQNLAGQTYTVPRHMTRQFAPPAPPTPRAPDFTPQLPPLALPAPDLLPSFAVKPHGGNWMPPKLAERLGYPLAPEHVVKEFPTHLGGTPETTAALDRWRDKNLLRWIKNDFGAPKDPVREVFATGRLPRGTNQHYDQMASESFTKRGGPLTVGRLIGPDSNFHPNEQQVFREMMPWLAERPVTDQLYGLSSIAGQNLGLPQLGQSMGRMINNVENLPRHLELDPGSIGRFSVADAYRRQRALGEYDEAKLREARRTGMTDNPALALHRDYPDDPQGMKWHEMQMPHDPWDMDRHGYSVLPDEDEMNQPSSWVDEDGDEHWDEDWEPSSYSSYDPEGKVLGGGYATENEAWNDTARHHLEKELGEEGELMGNCVGGYCSSLEGGGMRLFSLRDNQGNPYVNIELGKPYKAMGDKGRYTIEQIKGSGKRSNIPAGENADYAAKQALQLSSNRYGKDTGRDDWLLPYIHDFLNKGPHEGGSIDDWADIADLGNTGLERMHGKYVPHGTRSAAVAQAQQEMGAGPFGQMYEHMWQNDSNDLLKRLHGEEPDLLGEDVRSFMNGRLHPGQTDHPELQKIYSSWNGQLTPEKVLLHLRHPDGLQDDELDDMLKVSDLWKTHAPEIPSHLRADFGVPPDRGFAVGGVVKPDLTCKCHGGRT